MGTPTRWASAAQRVVAPPVAEDQVVLDLHQHRVPAEPRDQPAQRRLSLPLPAGGDQLGDLRLPASGQAEQASRVSGELGQRDPGIEPPALAFLLGGQAEPVDEREQAAEVAVALSGPAEKGQVMAGAASVGRDGELGPGDRFDPHLTAEAGELERAEQVIVVGTGEGPVPELGVRARSALWGARLRRAVSSSCAGAARRSPHGGPALPPMPPLTPRCYQTFVRSCIWM